jgi:hypothetical protein
MEGQGKDGRNKRNGVGNEGVLRYLADSGIRGALLRKAEGAQGLPGSVAYRRRPKDVLHMLAIRRPQQRAICVSPSWAVKIARRNGRQFRYRSRTVLFVWIDQAFPSREMLTRTHHNFTENFGDLDGRAALD